MHSSKDPASRSCTFRAMFRAFLFLALCVCITMLLNYALIPPSSVRINLHNLRNGQQYDTIFIGTSHGQYGIDPAAVDQATGTSSVSLCMADAYPDDMYYLEAKKGQVSGQSSLALYSITGYYAKKLIYYKKYHF